MMMQPLSLPQQIEANFRKVEASPEFGGERLWLTFTLWGQPESLGRLVPVLESDGWLNTGGAEGGFLYPQVAVRNIEEDILARAQWTEKVCRAHQVGIILIDADTTQHIIGQECPFVTLYKNPD
jgi:hypothetical protein